MDSNVSGFASINGGFRMTFKLLVFVSCGLTALLFAVAAEAQSDFARAHGKFLMGATQPAPEFVLNFSYQPDVGTEDKNIQTDLVKVKTRLGTVFGVNEDVAIVTSLNYGLRSYAFDGSTLDVSLHEIALELGVNWFLSDRILLSATFRPGIFSDLDESLTGDDIQYQGTAVGTYQWSDKLFFKLGAAVREDFDKLSVVPVAGVTWVSSDQLRVDVLLPRFATITWQTWVNSSILIVPGLHLGGQQYHVDTALGDGDVQIQDIRFDITASYEVAEAARVSLSVGSNFRGKYEVEGDGGFKAKADQDPSVYLAVGLSSNF